MSREHGASAGPARRRRPEAAARAGGRRRPNVLEADPGLSLARLAAAVREHRAKSSGRAVPIRPADHDLYRRLEAIEAVEAVGR